MKIGYVCTNYNNSHYTHEAIRTLTSDSKNEYFIVVVDNNSNKINVNELDSIKKEFKNVTLILNQENVGYFKGLNLGIINLKQQHPEVEWMVIGNNDLEFPKGFALALELNLPRLKNHAVISPDVLTIDGLHQNPHVISSISKTREFFYDIYYSNYYLGLLLFKLVSMLKPWTGRKDELQWKNAQLIHQGHGSCYILGPRFFELFEKLWAPTFMMAEEFFLSKQLMDAGQKIYYEPGIQVIHHWHASLSKVPGKKRWTFARDSHRLMRKYKN